MGELSTREDDYYEWVIDNPIKHWNVPTYILRPEVDLLLSEEVGRDFIREYRCQVTIMPDGEHWLHSTEHLAIMKEWEVSTVS